MKIKHILFSTFFFVSLLSHAENDGRFFAVTEAGQTKLAAPTTSSYSFTSNSWDVGIGYENGSHQLEFTAGSAMSLSSTTGGTTTSYDLSSYSYIYNYKILTSGNFRPFIGFGRYGGTQTVTSGTAETYSRNIYDLGIEVPLDDNSSIRLKYLKSLEVTGYTTISAVMLGLLYRF